MKINNVVVAAAMALLGTGVTAHAQTIVNGTFPTDLSGWTTQGPNTTWVNDLGPDSVPGCAWLNDAPGPVCFIQQTISSLIPGSTYQITGFYRSRVIFASTGSFTATIDGNTEFANPDTDFVSSWTPFSFQFTATATSAVLRLNSQVGSDSDYTVDNIAISQVGGAAAPEPGSLALIAGVGGIVAVRVTRRRRCRA